MTVLFLQLLNMSITAGWLVLAVVLLRLLLKKAPKALVCVLWGLVALRLIFPVSIESAFSLIPNTSPITQEPVPSAHTSVDGYFDSLALGAVTPDITIANDSTDPIVSAELTDGGTVAFATPHTDEQHLLDIAAGVWIAGVIALLLYSVWGACRLHKTVKVSLRLRENIFVCDNIESPFIFGTIRPRIYLPSHLTDEQAECVIAHEQAHLRRGDYWLKPLGFLLLSVYWFHPLMWLGYILFSRDIEMACDERAIRSMTNAEKAVYSQTLLTCSMPRRMIAAYPLAFGEIGIKSRIRLVLHYKKPAAWLVIVAVAAIALTALCFLTDPITVRSERADAPTPSSASLVLTADSVPYSADWQTTGLQTVGLSDTEISRPLAAKYGNLYVLSGRADAAGKRDIVLAYETAHTVYFAPLGAATAIESIRANDPDRADWTEYMFVRQMDGERYAVCVYRLHDSGMTRTVSQAFSLGELDTGFDIHLEQPFLLVIENRAVGYRCELQGQTTIPSGNLFDETGTPITDYAIRFEPTPDRFYPSDADGDGNVEIVCVERLYLLENNCIGELTTVLEYQPQSGSFAVVQAAFEEW